ncbi:hypothetical protein HZA57_09020, partial [Candidatus Poribacteria bacterium]|nr:hypothetical protein [Candidatus Poribacteria bacterium]
MRRWNLRLCAVALAGVAASAPSQVLEVPDAPNQSFWMVDGDIPGAGATVNSAVRLGDAIYIGGDFAFLAPDTAGFSVIDPATGRPNHRLAHLSGNTTFPASAFPTESAPDGRGGWYVHGGFTRAGKVPCNGFARLHASGKATAPLGADPFAGAFTAMTLSTDHSKLYLGGSFPTVLGQTRNGLAALETGTDELLPFSPSN